MTLADITEAKQSKAQMAKELTSYMLHKHLGRDRPLHRSIPSGASEGGDDIQMEGRDTWPEMSLSEIRHPI